MTAKIIDLHPETKPEWWKQATVYQIYPASFKDSNGDGWGDLNGIRSKLPYLKDLGVDAIWICPFYDSPQKDMGYDIRNYTKVWPTYGTDEDSFNLISEAHAVGMRVLVDLVINHCSDQHEWFEESRKDKTNPKRDWFFWRPPKGVCPETGKPLPPNNWRSFFGGSAWQYDEATGEFYLHLFAVGQPDLNWENLKCRQAIYDSAVGFWLQHGVDGFRIDTAGLYSKVEGLPDAPVVNPKDDYQVSGDLVHNGPKIHEYHQEMHKYMLSQVKDGREIMTVGEVGDGDDDARRKYTSAKEGELSEMFIFSHVNLESSPKFKYDLVPHTLKDWKVAIADSFSWIDGTDSWSAIFLENHDQARSVTRFGDDSTKESRVASAKLLCTLEIALTGTLYVYQGQELGQINFKDWPIEDYEDVEVRTNYKVISEKFGRQSEEMAEFEKGVALLSRDYTRTPMPWTGAEPHAGFTESDNPWFRLNDSFSDGINVADEEEDANSVLNFWKSALVARKTHCDILVYGYNFQFYELNSDKLFGFTKEYDDKKLFAILNFSKEDAVFSFPQPKKVYKKFFGTHRSVLVENFLRPWEGRLYYVE